jgi:hypothetical protein
MPKHNSTDSDLREEEAKKVEKGGGGGVSLLCMDLRNSMTHGSNGSCRILCDESELTREVMFEHLVRTGAIRRCEVLTLNVGTMDGASFELKVAKGDETSRIGEVKRQIELEDGTPQERQVLLYLGDDENVAKKGASLNDSFVLNNSCGLYLVKGGPIIFSWDRMSALFRPTDRGSEGGDSEIDDHFDPPSPQPQDAPVYERHQFSTVCREGPDDYHYAHTMTVTPAMTVSPTQNEDDICSISFRIKEDAAAFGGHWSKVGLHRVDEVRTYSRPLPFGPRESMFALAIKGTSVPDQCDNVVTMKLDRRRGLLRFWVNGKSRGNRDGVAVCRAQDRHPFQVQWVLNAPTRSTEVSIVDDPDLD